MIVVSSIDSSFETGAGGTGTGRVTSDEGVAEIESTEEGMTSREAGGAAVASTGAVAEGMAMRGKVPLAEGTGAG
jgi:hypothetical protein